MKSNSDSSKNLRFIGNYTEPRTKTETNSPNINQYQIDDKKTEKGVYEVFNQNNDENISQNSILSKKTSRSHEDCEINIIPQNEENINSDEIFEKEPEEEEVGEEAGENNLNINNEIINNKNIITNNINKDEKKIKEKKNKIREDNIRKEVLKTACNNLKKYLEKIGNIKLKVNLDDVFGNRFCQNRAAMQLPIYTIFNFNKENKHILEKANPNPEKKDIFYYLSTRPYKYIYQKYINNDKQFEIKGEKITIDELKTLDEVVEEKKEKVRNNKNITDDERNEMFEKINKFEEISKGFLKNIENGFFDERSKKKTKKEKLFFIIRTIKKFEDFVSEEEQI